MTSTPTIGFPGTGRMGRPMAMNLIRAGFPPRVGNGAAPLAAVGATLAAAYAGAGTP